MSPPDDGVLFEFGSKYCGQAPYRLSFKTVNCHHAMSENDIFKQIFSYENYYLVVDTKKWEDTQIIINGLG